MEGWLVAKIVYKLQAIRLPILNVLTSYQEQLMAWNAITCQHEASIPLPIGSHEFKFVSTLALHSSRVAC